MFVPNKLRLDPSLATTVNSVSLHVDEARAAISQLGLVHHDATKDHVNALESKLSKCEKWVKGARGLSTIFGQAVSPSRLPPLSGVYSWVGWISLREPRS
mmetsp:Transcript_3759/g.5480  ORF Transcript_3759/g.5480 Transcript_3759/m.5480 type:complete len:100 (+) Transcript_3759:2875-3174(+)